MCDLERGWSVAVAFKGYQIGICWRRNALAAESRTGLLKTLEGLPARNYAKIQEMHGIVRRGPEPDGDVKAPTRP